MEDMEQFAELMKAMQGRSFQLGKLFFKETSIPNTEQVIRQTLEELAPLYFALN